MYTVTLNTYITAVNTVHYHNVNLSTTFELGVYITMRRAQLCTSV